VDVRRTKLTVGYVFADNIKTGVILAIADVQLYLPRGW
jgi:hypothetical protein